LSSQLVQNWRLVPSPWTVCFWKWVRCGFPVDTSIRTSQFWQWLVHHWRVTHHCDRRICKCLIKIISIII
jgi:hypothetical protein